MPEAANTAQLISRERSTHTLVLFVRDFPTDVQLLPVIFPAGNDILRLWITHLAISCQWKGRPIKHVHKEDKSWRGMKISKFVAPVPA